MLEPLFARVSTAVIQLALAQPSTAPLRAAIDAFLIRMSTVNDDWLESLPRVLWELGATNEKASTDLLLFLLRLGQKRIHASIAPRLTAFYTMPAKRPPYARLSSPTQKLARDVASVYNVRAPILDTRQRV